MAMATDLPVGMLVKKAGKRKPSATFETLPPSLFSGWLSGLILTYLRLSQIKSAPVTKHYIRLQTNCILKH